MISKIDITAFWEESDGEGGSTSRSFSVNAESAEGLTSIEIAELIRKVRFISPRRSQIEADGNEITSV